MSLFIEKDRHSLIEGLHHITTLAGNVHRNNQFFTRVLGLRRVKQTVHNDSPDIYHLYYGDKTGRPGTVMTSFAIPRIRRGRHGAGGGRVAFAVRRDTLSFWYERLSAFGLKKIKTVRRFDESTLSFSGLDGELLSLVEVEKPVGVPWKTKDIPQGMAIRGCHSAALCLGDHTPVAELLVLLGYEEIGREANCRRFSLGCGNGANIIDIETNPAVKPAQPGAGSVHHIAFSIADLPQLLILREALLDAGYRVTSVHNHTYFQSIYLRAPGGVLFEISTNGPGFDKDEDIAHLGKSLKLPKQHRHMQAYLNKHLKPLQD